MADANLTPVTEEAIKLPKPAAIATDDYEDGWGVSWKGDQPESFSTVELFTADQLRAAILAAKMEERERLSSIVTEAVAVMHQYSNLNEVGQSRMDVELDEALSKLESAIRKGE